MNTQARAGMRPTPLRRQLVRDIRAGRIQHCDGRWVMNGYRLYGPPASALADFHSRGYVDVPESPQQATVALSVDGQLLDLEWGEQ
jgi:hypothetical protein